MSYNNNYALEKPELGPADNYFSRVCTKKTLAHLQKVAEPSGEILLQGCDTNGPKVFVKSEVQGDFSPSNDSDKHL